MDDNTLHSLVEMDVVIHFVRTVVQITHDDSIEVGCLQQPVPVCRSMFPVSEI
jgi:hypothetical protein